MSELNAQAIFSLKDWLKLISDSILVNRKNTLDILAQKHAESRPFMESDPRTSGSVGVGSSPGGLHTGVGTGTGTGVGGVGVGGTGMRGESDDTGRLWVGSRSLRKSRDDAAVRCVSPYDDLMCSNDVGRDRDGNGDGDSEWDGEVDESDRDGEGGQSTDDYLSSSSDSESHSGSGAEDILSGHTAESTQRTQHTNNSRARAARSFKRRARERKRREMYMAHHSAIAETQLTRFTEPLLSLAHTLILRDMRAVPTVMRWGVSVRACVFVCVCAFPPSSLPPLLTSFLASFIFLSFFSFPPSSLFSTLPSFKTNIPSLLFTLTLPSFLHHSLTEPGKRY